MATDQTVRRRMKLEIRSAAKVEGNRGPQWQLEAKYPFSQYPQKGWIDREEGSEIAPGTYWCGVERGALKDGKSGEKDYDYFWNIVAFNIPVPDGTAPAAGAPLTTSPPKAVASAPDWHAEPMKPMNPRDQRSIWRYQAAGLAMTAELKAREFGDVETIDMDRVVHRAAALYNGWLSVDVVPDAAAPVASAEAPPSGETDDQLPW